MERLPVIGVIAVEHIVKTFGGLVAVDDCSLEVATGSITGLIGPNGAGKTTLFNIIAGNLKPSSGRVLFNGEDVTSLEPHALFHKGLLRTFQIPHEFGRLTVLENLMVVPAAQAGENLSSAWFRPALVRRQEEVVLSKAREVLDFLNLTNLANTPAADLSGGQKKLLELGRTMMILNGKVVLLDEVGAGVNRVLLGEIGYVIRRLNEELGYTFCMIEHDLEFISRLCSRVIVMAEGKVLAEGTAEEVKANDAVIEAYLGSGMKSRSAREQPLDATT